jgi:hypothetical protein
VASVRSTPQSRATRESVPGSVEVSVRRRRSMRELSRWLE